MSRFFLVIILLTFFGVSGRAQVSGACADEASLRAALTSLPAGDKDNVSLLLQQNEKLVTPQLWEQLREGALKAYYDRKLAGSLWLYEVTRAVAQRLPERKLLALSHYDVGRTLVLLNQLPQAAAAYRASQTAFQEANSPRDLIYLLSDLSALYFKLEDYPQARDCAEQSLSLAARLRTSDEPPAAWPDQYGQAHAYAILGELAARDGQYEQALAKQEQALVLYRQLAVENPFYRQFVADTLAALGRVYTAAGNNAQALTYLKQALEIAAKLREDELLAGLFNSLGFLYLEQEDYAQAAVGLRQSLAIYTALQNRLETARVLLNLGVVEQRQNNFAPALDYFRRCVTEAQAVSAQDLLIAANEGQGAVLTAQGQYAPALEILQKTLGLAQASRNLLREGELHWRLAETHLAAMRYPTAESEAGQALALARQLRLPKLACLAATTLGQTYAKQNKPELAVLTLQQAVAGLERLRGQVAGPEANAQLFLARHLTPYYALIELLLNQGRDLEALLYAERAKGRVLLAILRDGKTDLNAFLTPAQQTRLQGFNDKLRTLDEQLRREEAKPETNAQAIEILRTELDEAYLNFDAALNLLYAGQPTLRLRRGAALPLTQESLSKLPFPGRQAFVEYTVTPTNSYVWVGQRATPDGEIKVTAYSLPGNAALLNAKVAQLQRRAADRSPLYDESARELYSLLIKPIAAQLVGADTLCIIPDGSLWNVPFQALLTDHKRYLLEDFALYYAPSLSVLQELHRPLTQPSAANGKVILALANPLLTQESRAAGPLPEAETEVASLAQAVGVARTRSLIGAAASEKSFKAAAASYLRLHLATHGALDNRHPLASHLLLTATPDEPENDGLLEAREIMALQLNADLAVLSACETANGKISPGEGLVGLSYAFFAAGCRATVVSQWQVKSGGTAQLMANFYPSLERGATKSEALRRAALASLKDPRYRHPFFWAGFVLIGRNE